MGRNRRCKRVRRPPVVLDPRSLRHGHRSATIVDNLVSAPTSTAWNPPPPTARSTGTTNGGPARARRLAVRRLGRRLEHLYESAAAAYTRRPVAARTKDPLAPFGPAVRAWFEATFEAPTPGPGGGLGGDQRRAEHPDPRAHRQRQDPGRVPVVPRPPGRGSAAGPHAADPGSVRVLYISPLKALAYDVERNLRAPLAGITLAAQRLGRSRRASRSRAAPATPRPTSAETSSATRRTSSSPRPRASTCC